jgi:methylated-DNA-protein-cysteine methyltransferase-like protein
METERVLQPGFNARVYALVRLVPPGHVTTYGDIAGLLGSRRVARQVGYALAALTDPEVPWHRVINAQGRVSFKGDPVRSGEQRSRLEAEGVVFDAGERVDLAAVRWTFPGLELPELPQPKGE